MKNAQKICSKLEIESFFAFYRSEAFRFAVFVWKEQDRFKSLQVCHFDLYDKDLLPALPLKKALDIR